MREASPLAPIVHESRSVDRIRGSVGTSPERWEDRQALLRMVTNSLRKAERVAAALQKKNTRLVVAGISSSAAVTLFAGSTALQGRPLIGKGPDGWRLACTISAVLAFAATLCIALDKQLRISDRLSTANVCVGRLRSLDVLITTGCRSFEELTNDYIEIEQAFPEYCDPLPAALPLLPPWPPPPPPSPEPPAPP